MRGILDSRTFDVDIYFCMVIKYWKILTGEVKGYKSVKTSSSFIDHIIGLIIWRCMLGESTVSWTTYRSFSKDNKRDREMFEQCLAELELERGDSLFELKRKLGKQ